MWFHLFFTIPQSWYPYICLIPLFVPRENPTLRPAISLRAVLVINQSAARWHTAKLAALTWYIPQAGAATNTPESSGGSRLMQRLCWVWGLRQQKFLISSPSNTFFVFGLVLRSEDMQTHKSREIDSAAIWREAWLYPGNKSPLKFKWQKSFTSSFGCDAGKLHQQKPNYNSGTPFVIVSVSHCVPVTVLCCLHQFGHIKANKYDIHLLFQHDVPVSNHGFVVGLIWNKWTL